VIREPSQVTRGHIRRLPAKGLPDQGLRAKGLPAKGLPAKGLPDQATIRPDQATIRPDQVMGWPDHALVGNRQAHRSGSGQAPAHQLSIDQLVGHQAQGLPASRIRSQPH
jgi:hypothetical protein